MSADGACPLLSSPGTAEGDAPTTAWQPASVVELVRALSRHFVYTLCMDAITPIGIAQQRISLSTEDRARARRFGQMIREADRAVCTILARIRQPLLARAQRSVRPRPELLV